MIPYGIIQDRYFQPPILIKCVTVVLLLNFVFFSRRIERIAKDIFNTFGREPLVAICVLKGGYKFYTDLIDKITSLNRNHGESSVPLCVDFIRLRSYEVLA